MTENYFLDRDLAMYDWTKATRWKSELEKVLDSLSKIYRKPHKRKVIR